MYLVGVLRPALLVELGTRNGVSYCAFCQAIQHLDLRACSIAVDSWQGDPHTGKYGASVLTDLQHHHDPLYGAFSRLHQSTFDEAASIIGDGSVDLLHIDGFHTYSAARHDFETWLPKMSQRSVVLFHDIGEHRRDFGVWRLWAELSRSYPSFAFHHGHGLGVLAVGGTVPQAAGELMSLSEAQARAVRQFFVRRGRQVEAGLMLDLAAGLPARFVASLSQMARKLNPGSAAGG